MVCLFWMLIWNIVNTMQGGQTQLFTHIKSQFSLNKENVWKQWNPNHTPHLWIGSLIYIWIDQLIYRWIDWFFQALNHSSSHSGTLEHEFDWLIGWLCDWFQHGPVFAQFAIGACLKQLKAVLLDCLLNWLIHWLLVEWLISVVNMVKSQLNRSLL